MTSHSSFKRIAGFSSSAFGAWAPKLHEYYRENIDDLLGSNPKLRRNFNNSIWAAAAFNFGPQTCALRHRDFVNLPFGWCAVTALGDFDPTKGGHLVLWELDLVIEFPLGPPSSSPLLPFHIQTLRSRGGRVGAHLLNILRAACFGGCHVGKGRGQTMSRGCQRQRRSA